MKLAAMVKPRVSPPGWASWPSVLPRAAPPTGEAETVVALVGSYLAIPHGTNESKAAIKHSAVSLVRYRKPDRLGRKRGAHCCRNCRSQ
jgi:hypothetical protein